MTGADLRTVEDVAGKYGDSLFFRGLVAEAAGSSGNGGAGRKRLVVDWTTELESLEQPDHGRLGKGGGVGDNDGVHTTECTGDRCGSLGGVETRSRLSADELLSTDTGDSFGSEFDCKDATKLCTLMPPGSAIQRSLMPLLLQLLLLL